MTSPPAFSANRRLGRRRFVANMEVFVTSEGSEIKGCRLRDIGIGGAFIESTNFTLTEGTNLDLVLGVLREGETEVCPVEAEVIRVAKDGAALIFDRVDQRLYYILVDIVNGADWVTTGNGTVFMCVG